ncbi:MAG: lytic transglycosylase F, partial [Bacteroidales bacterium]|nr:lytic transglycosylase F [Bacteroidales bacterium]
MLLRIAFLLILVVFFSACGGEKNKQPKEKEKEELSVIRRIQETGILKVVIDYNSTNYFVYRGKPMGYQYELVLALCEDLDVKP